MELIAIWLALAAVVAVHAGRQGRSTAVWLVAGVLLSPLLAAVLLFGFGPGVRPQAASRASGSVLAQSAWAGVLSITGVLLMFQGLTQFSA